MVYQGQSTQPLFKIIKQNTHYCVNIRFLFVQLVKRLHVSTLLLGHPQAYAIQASVTVFNMNSYCAHILRMLLLVLKFDSFKMQYIYI
jgi:hypothetical protein